MGRQHTVVQLLSRSDVHVNVCLGEKKKRKKEKKTVPLQAIISEREEPLWKTQV